MYVNFFFSFFLQISGERPRTGAWAYELKGDAS